MTPSVVVRLLCRAGPVAGVLFLAPAPLLAQNLVTNPNFNTDLSTWQVSGGTFDATVDANASPSSGSVHIVQTVPGSNNASSTGVIQCIDGVVGGSTYNFGSKILLASAPAGGSVVTGLIFASGPGCGPPTQQVFSAAVTPGAGFQAANGTIVAPAGSQSVQISKFAITGANPGDFDMARGRFLLSARRAGSGDADLDAVLAGAVAGALRRRGPAPREKGEARNERGVAPGTAPGTRHEAPHRAPGTAHQAPGMDCPASPITAP
jgi:hypothetical protein